MEEEELQDSIQLDHTMAPKIFKPGEFVLLRLEMTAEDDIAIKNRLARLRGKGKSAEMVMTLGDSELATMERMILGWNLSRKVVDPQGHMREMPLAFNRENVKRLPKKVWDYVYKKINEYNPDMDEEEQEHFLPSVIDASEEGFETERVYRLK